MSRAEMRAKHQTDDFSMRASLFTAFRTVEECLPGSFEMMFLREICLNVAWEFNNSVLRQDKEGNMLNKLAAGLVIGISAGTTSAQSLTNIQANPTSSAYLQDGRGVVARSGHGLCWRTGYWTPADSIAGCDGELAPPIVKATAPPIAPPVAEKTTSPAPTPPAAQSPKRCDFAVTLENDQTFQFGKTLLTMNAKKRIDEAVLSKLSACGKIDIIIVTGHADRLGSQQFNQKLSDQRANMVAAYLKSKGVAVPIDTLGAGKTQSVKSCSDKLDHKTLVECLAPNRRVVIEVRGLTKPN